MPFKKLYRKLLSAWKYLKRGVFIDYFKYKLFYPYAAIERHGQNNVLVTLKDGTLFSVPEQGEYVGSLNPIVELLVSTYFKVESGVFVDIGAFVGKYSIAVAKKKIPVVAVEPNPCTYKILEENIKLNHVEHYVTMVNKAIYCKNVSEISFYDNQSISRIVSDEEMPSDSNDECFVEGVTFDTLLKSLEIHPQDVTLIKMDVEGLESVLLSSMEFFLKHSSPRLKLICEILHNSPDKMDTIVYMQDCGFNATQIDMNNYYFSK